MVAQPGEQQFTEWRRFLRQTYCISIRPNKLRQKLGPWHQNHHSVEWTSYHDSLLECVYIRQDSKWEVQTSHTRALDPLLRSNLRYCLLH